MRVLPVVIVAFIVVVAFVTVRHLAKRASAVSDVNDWFAEQMLIFPPQPLASEYSAVIRSIMDDDLDLWYTFICGCDIAERQPYYEQAANIGRYLCVFGPVGVYQTQYRPSIYYGVFDDGDENVFRTWIEFRYRDDTVWVLTENNGAPEIVRFFDFRVNHPGLIHRHPIYFVHDGLAANV